MSPISQPLHLLLIEDNPGDARLVRLHLEEALETRFTLEHAESLEGGIEHIQASPPDLVLLDLGLPDARGLEALRSVRSADGSRPIVVLTGLDDEATALEALRNGAQDYLAKDALDAGSLRRSIRYSLERHRAALQLERARKDAERQREYNVSILRSLPHHIAVLDGDGTIRTVNEAWRSFAEEEGGDPRGYEGESYLAVTEAAADESEHASAMLEGLRGVLSGRAPSFTLEYPCHSPDRKRWFRVSVTPLGGDASAGAVVSHIDITERRLAEAELRRSEERFRALSEHASDGIVVMTSDHRIVYVNPAMEELFGYERGELVGSSVLELIPEELREEHREGVRRYLETGRRGLDWSGVEFPAVREDGERIEVEVSFADYEVEGRRHFTGMIRDISERTAMERALRERELLYRTLVETAAEGVLLADREGRFEYANPVAERMLGLGEAEIAERSYRDPEWGITRPDGSPMPDEELPVARVLRTGSTVTEVEHAVRHPDGSRIVISVNAAPLGDPEGEITGVVATLRDVTERKKLEEQLRHQALHDPLTGLANRTLFEDRLGHAVARARRRSGQLGVLMVDLKHFKRINDGLGHTAGDRVLQETARRLESSLRGEDSVARWGGDEFVLLLEEIEEAGDLRVACDRLLQALRQPVSVADEVLHLDATVGGVLCDEAVFPTAPESEGVDDLIRYADQALRRAKMASGPSLHLFRPEAGEGGAQVAWIRQEQALRRGLQAGEFEPFYQPIVRLDTGRVWAVEPLARWRHPERGLVPPGEFIPLAEESGLIHELGLQVFAEGCRQVAAWNRAGHVGEELKVTPNVSVRQFEEEGFTDDLQGALASADLSPERVLLEVTETSIMRASHRIEELRELGVGLIVDDFGTGYSSLMYVRDLDVDGLKIDMTFVQGLGVRASDTAIVRTILTLGRELDLTVIAEGIETGDQLRRMREMGCEIGQGFYFGRPVPAGEMAALLERGGPLGGDGSDRPRA